MIFSIIYFVPEDYITQAIIEKKTLILASMFIYFYLLSVIQGMLLKILPFLSYTHLQQRCLTNFLAMQFIPHMHDFLSKKHGQWLFYLHILSGVFLLHKTMY